MERAVRLNPARGIYWYDLGKRYSFKSYDPYGYVNKWLPLAEECFDVGIKCAPMDANMLFDVAWYWVWRASMLDEEGEKVKVKGSRPKAVGEEGMTSLAGRDGWMIRTNPLEKSPQEWPSDSTGQAKLKVQSKEEAQMDERIFFRENGIRKFQELFQRSLEINPRRWKEAEERVREYFSDVTELTFRR